MFDFVKEYDKCLVCDSALKKVVFTKANNGWESEITFVCGCVCTIRDVDSVLGYIRQCPRAMEIVLQIRRGDIKVEHQADKGLK